MDQPWADFWARLGLRRRESDAETGQMSSVETGKMSSVETRQMSQQQSSVLSQQQTSVLSQQDRCLLLRPVLARTGVLIDVRQ